MLYPMVNEVRKELLQVLKIWTWYGFMVLLGPNILEDLCITLTP